MRIISGEFKGRRFDPPKNFKARPTTDFAKENLFNILNNHFDWDDIESALDLFAGTGSIGFEMVSRGCPNVTSVEKDAVHVTFIEKTKSMLKTKEPKVLKTDVFKFLESCKMQFDFIFADPPYDLKNFEDIPRIILEKDMIKDGGMFIIEHPRTCDFSGLQLFREHRVYGSVNFSIFCKD